MSMRNRSLSVLRSKGRNRSKDVATSVSTPAMVCTISPLHHGVLLYIIIIKPSLVRMVARVGVRVGLRRNGFIKCRESDEMIINEMKFIRGQSR